MPKTPLFQTQFSQGEVSDYIDARPDFGRRYNGVRVLENFWALPEGGATKRWGTMFGGECPDHDKFHRLIPFEYSISDAFGLIFGEMKIRFIKNRASVLDGGSPFQLVSPYAEADLRDIHHAQSSDFLFMTSLRPDLDVQKLARITDTNWVMNDFKATPPPSESFDEQVFTNPAIAGAPTSNGPGAAKWRSNDNFFLAEHAGRQIHFGSGKATILSLDAANQVNINIIDPFAAGISVGPGLLTTVGTSATTTADHGLSVGDFVVAGGLPRRVTNVTGAQNFLIDAGFGPDVTGVTWDKVTPVAAGDWRLTALGAPTLNGVGAAQWRTVAGVFLASDVGRQIISGAGRAEITAIVNALLVDINIIDPFAATIVTATNTLDSAISPPQIVSTAHGLAIGDLIVLTSGAQSGETRFVTAITSPDIAAIESPFSVNQVAVSWKKVVGIQSDQWLLNRSPQTTLDVDKKEPVGAQVALVFGVATLRTAYVGKFLRLLGGLIQITARTNDTTGTGKILTILEDAAGADPAIVSAGAWSLEEPSWSTIHGRPRTLTIHEGRLTFGGIGKFWGSNIDDIYNFAVGSLAEDAYQYNLQHGRQDAIQWMASHKVLYFGHTRAEHLAKGQGIDAPISGEQTPYVIPMEFSGSKHVQPIIIEDAILFVQRLGQDIVVLRYSLEESNDATHLVASEPTIYARHIGDMGFALHPPAYAQKPYSMVFFPLDNGQMANLTFKPRHDVVSWSRTKTRDGDEIESVIVLPHENGKKVTILQTVKRIINGQTKRYWEYYEDDDPNLQTRTTDGVKWAALQTDCAKTGTILAGATTITGLSHLEGETVRVYIGPDLIGEKTVSGGVVTLASGEEPTEDTTYEVGLAFDGEITTLRPAIPGEITEGLKRDWPIVFVRLKHTIGGTINGKRLKPQQGAQRMFTGLAKMENLSTPDPYDGALTILSEGYPMEVLGISGKIRWADDFS